MKKFRIRAICRAGIAGLCPPACSLTHARRSLNAQRQRRSMALDETTIRKSSGQFLLIALPKILGGVLTFALNLVLLRHFGPSEFGIYALCVAIILLADSIIGTSLDMSVLRLAPLYRQGQYATSLSIQRTGLWIKVILGLAACALVALFAGPLSRILFHRAGLQPLLYLACAAISALLLLRSAQVHSQVCHRFAIYGALELMQLITKFGGIAALLLFGHVTVLNVLLFFIFGPLAGFAVWRASFGREFSRAAPFKRAMASEIWRYSRWFLLTFGLAALISRLDLFLLARWSSLAEVGIFSAGQLISWIPQLIGTYLAVLVTPRIMPLVKSGEFYSFFKSLQSKLLAGCALLYAVSLIAVPPLCRLLLPAKYSQSLPVILVLLPGAFAGLASFPLTIGFVMFIKPRFLFVMDCISLPVLLLLYRYAIAQHGAVGAAWVTTAANLSRAAIAQILAWKWARELDGTEMQTDTALSDPFNLALEVS